MTRDELKGIIEGISDEQLKRILDINSSDIGKAKNGAEALKKALDEATARSKQMEAEIEQLKIGQREADEMREKIGELQKVIDQKNEAEERTKSENALNTRFGLVTEGMDFVNDFTRKGVFEQFKNAVLDENNMGKSDGEIYEALTLGRENLFVPQGGIPSVVGSTMGFDGNITEGDVREIMGLPTKN
ncbi:MAG: hypothetical protein IKW62_01620 [Clostridia bacterium]|nr:hypothetical protein [Clostridia bacterium]